MEQATRCNRELPKNVDAAQTLLSTWLMSDAVDQNRKVDNLTFSPKREGWVSGASDDFNTRHLALLALFSDIHFHGS